jgi:hypothetical protein
MVVVLTGVSVRLGPHYIGKSKVVPFLIKNHTISINIFTIYEIVGTALSSGSVLLS